MLKQKKIAHMNHIQANEFNDLAEDIDKQVIHSFDVRSTIDLRLN